MNTVVLCSSAAFYEHVNTLADELEEKGFKAVVPKSARAMKAVSNYDVSKTKTWYDNPEDFHLKQDYIRAHFEEIANGDAILVVNDEKHGVPGYIGPNVLLEMGIAFYLGKPIYVLNDVGKDVSVYEEVYGLGSIILNGDISKLEK